MERSLTVLLPVENAQSTLKADVLRLLEILPELTDRLEIAIIDDGSTDSTIEVADELATEYPQVRVLRNATSHGRTRTIQEGIRRTSGEVILLIDEDCCLPVEHLRTLWEASHEHEIVLGRFPQRPIRESCRHRRLDRGSHGGYQMLRRHAAERHWDSVGHQLTLRAELLRTEVPWHEIELGRGHPLRRDRAVALGSRPAKPNYLRALRDFALGE